MFCIVVFLFTNVLKGLTSASTTTTFFLKHFFKESKVCKKYPTVKHLGSCNFFDVWPSEDRKAIGDQRSKVILHKSCGEFSHWLKAKRFYYRRPRDSYYTKLEPV